MKKHSILSANYLKLASLVFNAMQHNPVIEVTVPEADTNQIFEKDRSMFGYMMDTLMTL